jgi:hypothetical protein
VDTSTQDPAYGSHMAAEDPTKAIWRRIFAYVIDAVVGGLIVGLVFLAMADIDTQKAERCPDPAPSGASATTPTGARRSRATRSSWSTGTPSGSPPGWRWAGASSTRCCSRA